MSREIKRQLDVMNVCPSRHKKKIETRETHVALDPQKLRGSRQFWMCKKKNKTTSSKYHGGRFSRSNGASISHFKALEENYNIVVWTKSRFEEKDYKKIYFLYRSKSQIIRNMIREPNGGRDTKMHQVRDNTRKT